MKAPAWYAAYWAFAAQYLESRFGEEWCLGADQSLLLHVGDRTIPPQLLVRAPKGSNKPTPLPHDTSVFDVRLELPAAAERTTIEGVRVMTLAAALAYCSPDMFRTRPVELRTALAMLTDAADLLRCLLEGGKSKVAGRLAGALRNVGARRPWPSRCATPCAPRATPSPRPTRSPNPRRCSSQAARSRPSSGACACSGPRCVRPCSSTFRRRPPCGPGRPSTCSRWRTCTAPTPTTPCRSRATR